MRFVRQNAQLVAEKARQKGYEVDVKHLLQLDEQRRQLLAELEKLRGQRNELTEQIKGAKPTDQQILLGKSLRQQIDQLEKGLQPVEVDFASRLKTVPNVFPDDTPLGDETANREEKRWGETAAREFAVLDHLTWGKNRGLIDFERGAKVAGNKFYYLKSGLVDLELALTQFSLHLVKRYDFWPMSVPHLVNTRILEGAGFSAKGNEKQVYKIEDEDLNLIATAEIPLTCYHADEILEASYLPRLYCGLSPSYRVEGGAYGQYNRGLFRTHQFNKLEL